jgi:hypothetical protein
VPRQILHKIPFGAAGGQDGRGLEVGREAATLFGALSDWRVADSDFLRRAIGPLGFVSDEGYRYFLPAFLLADIDGALGRRGIVESLVFDFVAGRRDEPVNPRRFGARTWLDEGRYKFATFTNEMAAAIVEYLRWKRRNADASAAAMIDDALEFYWLRRSTK